jgi:hypothetical protein
MPEISPIYTQLRDVLVATTADTGSMEPADDLPHVYGVVVDIGFEMLFTVAVYTDGRVIACDANGGGFNNLGEIPETMIFSRAILRAVENNLDLFAPVENTPLPAFGRVRFSVLTYGGLRSANLEGPPLLKGQSPLSHAFAAVMGIMDLARHMVVQPDKNESWDGTEATAEGDAAKPVN